MSTLGVAQALANLDAWLETMRQPGGYGGPVAHWWQNRYCYTGPGLDWRYEGILMGYSALLRKTHDARWRERLNRAASDLLDGQQADGSYRASRFEINPGTLGTPHEAAATLGLLTALPCLSEKERALEAAGRNLDNLIAKLWDQKTRGFNDRPGVPGRVPNKLATLAQALMLFGDRSKDESCLPYARAALDEVLGYQLQEGRLAGAVHQYAPGAREGDGRFFPYYAARCVPPLVLGASRFDDARYLRAAQKILGFLRRTMTKDGSWPQIVYSNGKRADWPRWLAGVADILLAYRVLGEEVPGAALERLLASQLASGGFPTARGFAGQVSQRPPTGLPDYRDTTPVVGWNDKVFRVLTALLEEGEPLPAASVGAFRLPVVVRGEAATLEETAEDMRVVAHRGALLYCWRKLEPWATTVSPLMEVR